VCDACQCLLLALLEAATRLIKLHVQPRHLLLHSLRQRLQLSLQLLCCQRQLLLCGCTTILPLLLLLLQ
jgi:hypothetical protein